ARRRWVSDRSHLRPLADPSHPRFRAASSRRSRIRTGTVRLLHRQHGRASRETRLGIRPALHPDRRTDRCIAHHRSRRNAGESASIPWQVGGSSADLQARWKEASPLSLLRPPFKHFRGLRCERNVAPCESSLPPGNEDESGMDIFFPDVIDLIWPHTRLEYHYRDVLKELRRVVEIEPLLVMGKDSH